MRGRIYIRGSLVLLALFGPLCILFSVSCVKLPHSPQSTASQVSPTSLPYENRATPPVNINTASREELERLPGIGRALALRIISYREQYGRFRRAEHVMMVRGIGDRRFRRLQSFIRAE